MDTSPPALNPYAPPVADVNVAAPDPAPGLELASRWARLGGSLVDGILGALTALPHAANQILGATSRPGVHVAQLIFSPFDRSVAGVVSTSLFLGLVAMQSYFLAVRGQTVGKRVAGTRIVGLDGSPASFAKVVVLRYWVVLALPLVRGVGGLLPLVDVVWIFGPTKRCLHDLAAGTRVVRTD
jgi:uncharacterized RDD family membrane protein YckC